MSGDKARRRSISVLWQREYHSRWISYPISQQRAINKAYENGEKTFTVPNHPKKAVIDFEKMHQMNTLSGWLHRIRCCVRDKVGDFYVWEWEASSGNWSYYTLNICLDLEASFKTGKTVKFSIGNDNYVISTKALKQTNTTTKAERNIQRRKVNIDLLEQKVACVYYASPPCLKRKADLDHSSPIKKPATTEANVKERSTNPSFSVKVPVDSGCKLMEDVHVYYDRTDIYNVILCQTTLETNSNKYYVIQLLKENSCEKFYVFIRWGRVGRKGVSKLLPAVNLLDAKDIFMKKFKEKTGNKWYEKEKFVKFAGKHSLLKVDYTIEENKKDSTVPAVKTSSLEPKVADLMRLICNIDDMKRYIVNMKYDVLERPLGKLTKEQITAGYAALRSIEEAIEQEESHNKLLAACNDFYTCIPHNFGNKKPPVIETIDEIEEKVQLLEALSNVEIYMNIEKELQAERIVDGFYRIIHSEIKVIDPNSETFKIIDECIRNTHGITHVLYTTEIITAYECNRERDDLKFIDYGNKKLLWHGSRIRNFVGILKNGLQIAPKEAPITGHMFGKGIYFADVSSKSSNYCHATVDNNEGLLLLCEVSLGKERLMTSANFFAPLEIKSSGFHSVKANGLFEPKRSQSKFINGLKLACGKPVRRNSSMSYLMYNEYVIYNANQVKIRYIIHIKFNFK